MTEKAVDAVVTRALRDLGFHVTRLQQPRATKQTPGTPDLYARHRRFGRVWIELKAPGKKPSPAQLAWHADERDCGGRVLVVDGIEALIRGLREEGVQV
jgi:hypothetical protein